MTQIAIVTGGTGGIGTAIARKLRDDGYQVIATSHSQESSVKWQKDELNQGIAVLPVEVSDFSSCEAFAEKVLADFGVPYLIVNNAGITRDAPMKRMSAEQWNEVISTNLNSVFNITRQFLNGMLEANAGRVVNISSINGQKGQFGQTNYSAAKAGMHGFSMALAQEVARNKITVNTISPGYTDTAMVRAVREDILANIINQVPMKRLALPEEIASLTAFLASKDAAYISGANIPINGAQYTS